MGSGVWLFAVIAFSIFFTIFDIDIVYAQETLSEDIYGNMDEADKLNVDYQLISSWCFHQYATDVWSLLNEQDCDFVMVYVSEICQTLYNIGIRPVYCPETTGYIVERGLDSNSDNDDYLNDSNDDNRFNEVRIKYHNNNPAK